MDTFGGAGAAARGSSIVSKNGRGTSHETWMICEHVGDRYRDDLWNM